MQSQGSLSFAMTDDGDLQVACQTGLLTARYRGSADHTIFLAVDKAEEAGLAIAGSSVVPFAQGWEGSTVFLPFAANRLYAASRNRRWMRQWQPQAWNERREECPGLHVARVDTATTEVSLDLGERAGSSCRVAVYVKDVPANDGWGDFIGCCDAAVTPGWGDKAIEAGILVDTAGSGELALAPRSGARQRERIYELFVRVFGNANTNRKANGTLAENGCGHFADITEAAIARIADMGFTHIWLMGVVRHATTTRYNLPGLSADETDLMKGLAGSPYAIKDYFDVAPDLAYEPARRMEEFQALLERIHAVGLKVIIDFVGNHVSRSYRSEVRPELSFGAGDDESKFFAPENNFFYLNAGHPGDGPPLHLPTYNPETGLPISPTCAVRGDCDGLFAGELTTGRVTGNNSVTWSPSLHDWYETVKLNYGFDFTGGSQPQRCFPNAASPHAAIPDTWTKMDAVLEHWQTLGVDGFRCDMAHMLPPEFWNWSISRAIRRDQDVFFMAEAYNDYFAVTTAAPEVLALDQQPFFHSLLHAGFNAFYGHDVYRTIKGLYDGNNWANDIDGVLGSEYLQSHSVQYAENHDEVRLASPYAWNGLGMNVGRAASAVLFGVGRGPVLFYSGQEVGERAEEAEGFSGNDGRTSLFDYWSLPELSKWTNGGAFDGGGLSEEQNGLRNYYSRLVTICGREVFRSGQFFGLNSFNLGNTAYGRMPGDPVSGHWLYAFLRYSRTSGERLLGVANFHPMRQLADVRIHVPEEALHFLQISAGANWRMRDVLQADGSEFEANSSGDVLQMPTLEPLSGYYFLVEV